MSDKSQQSKSDVENLIERKIAEAKLGIAESRLRFALWFGGAAIAVFGVFIPIFQVYTSSREVAAAIEKTEQRAHESSAKVDHAIEKMRQEFQRLAGESLKKPDIIIQHNGYPMDGQEIIMDSHGYFDIQSLTLVNKGDKTCETVSVRIYLEFYAWSEYGEWQSLASPNPDYKCLLWISPTAKISPSERWVIPNSYFRVEKSQDIKDSVAAMIEVFYGVEQPAVAHFKIVPKRNE